MLAKKRKMVRLHKEVEKTIACTGLSKSSISKRLGYHVSYLNTVLCQGVTVEKEREIIKKLRDIKVNHYVNIRESNGGTHIHVKGISKELNDLKKENSDLRIKVNSLYKLVDERNNIIIQREDEISKLKDSPLEKDKSVIFNKGIFGYNVVLSKLGK
jgi:uncharacterized coiled-coil DUF342 family protein